MVDPILIDVPDRLIGDRVILRPYSPDDALEVWKAVNESKHHLARWLPFAKNYTRDSARTFVTQSAAKWLLREELNMGIFHRQTGQYLGSCGLHGINWTVRAFEVGYWVRYSAQGQGYISEAVRLLTTMAFEDLAANRVQIRMETANTRSENVAKGLGFILEGTLRCSTMGTDGLPKDHFLYALTRDDYLSSWK